MHQFQRVAGRKGQAAGQHLVKHHAQRVQIGAAVHGAVDAPRLFGRDIGQRSLQRMRIAGGRGQARQGGSDVEVNQFDAAAGRVQHDVGSRHVSMRDSRFVNGCQRVGQGNGGRQKLRYRHGHAVQVGMQRLSGRVFHDQGQAVAAGFERKRLRHARIAYLPHQPKFAAQALPFLLIGMGVADVLMTTRRASVGCMAR